MVVSRPAIERIRHLKTLGALEFKRSTTPQLTRSMHVAMGALALDDLCVVHAGTRSSPLAPRIRAVAFERLIDDVKCLH